MWIEGDPGGNHFSPRPWRSWPGLGQSNVETGSPSSLGSFMMQSWFGKILTPEYGIPNGSVFWGGTSDQGAWAWGGVRSGRE